MDFILVFLVLIIVLGSLLLFLLSNNSNKKQKTLNSAHIQQKWNSLQGARASKEIALLKSAILTSDKLVDHALKSINCQGNTMAERIKSGRNALGDKYEKLWDAHRTRNRMVHEIDTEVRFYEAQKALDIYEEVLRQLGVIH